MARVRDPDLWQAWRERLRRFHQSRETVAQFCRRERVSIPAFYQWKRKLSAGDDRPGTTGKLSALQPAARRASSLPHSQSPFVELVVPVRSGPGAAMTDNKTAVPTGCVEVRLPNGTCVRLASGDLPGLRTAILAAAEIRGWGAAGDTTC